MNVLVGVFDRARGWMAVVEEDEDEWLEVDLLLEGNAARKSCERIEARPASVGLDALTETSGEAKAGVGIEGAADVEIGLLNRADVEARVGFVDRIDAGAGVGIAASA